jgi:hypothetical protein
MKTKHTHKWFIQDSVNRDGRRHLTIACSTCGKTKSQSRKLPSSKSRKAIPRQSEKRKVLDKEYSKLRKAFLEAHPLCLVESCKEPATEVHHKGRRGSLYLRVESWLPVCRLHHDYIERNGKWAVLHGYSLSESEIREAKTKQTP